MKRLAAILLAVIASAVAASAQIAKIYRWDSSVEDGTAYGLAPTRGETMILQPRLLQYGEPMDLTHAYTVWMLYKAVGSTNSYSAPGSVLNATNGQIEVVFTASNELTASTYAYDILVSGPTTTVVGARGAIKYRDGVVTGAQLATNPPIYILDFAQVQLLNVGYAPFLSSYEISDIRAYLTGIQSGLADIDARNITIRGTLTYTNWPAYLARTSDIPLQVSVAAGANISVAVSTNAGRIIYTVTGAAGGGTGGGIGSYTNTSINGVTHSNNVYIADSESVTWLNGTDGVWRASAGIPAVWSASGRLYWVTDGLTNGYVDTNGITLLTGSLTLYEEDLTCNVRLYDGSRISPSLTFKGHPGTWGMFAKSFNGTYSAAWSQGGVEVGIMHLGGITLIRTNSYFTGLHAGDISACTGYPEPLWIAWSTNRNLESLTITNSGSITVKNAGGTTRFAVDGSTGATSIRGQDTDSRYVLANTNRPDFVMTNVFGGVTNVLWFADGICTNKTP